MEIITRNIREEAAAYFSLATTQPLLLNGDALLILQALPAESIDMVMTSPPYWQKRQYAQGGIGLEPEYTAYIRNLCQIIQ